MSAAELEEAESEFDKFIDISAPRQSTATDADGDGSIDMDSADADLTGRNFAAKTFDKIEQNISDSFSILANPKDEDMFTDYLLTNLKLYFDKYEDELKGVVAEPSTDEYEDEKAEMDAEPTDDEGGEELGTEEPAGDEDEEGIDIALQELFLETNKMTDTKKLYENFREFTELKGGGASNEVVGAWKQKLYDWVKQNAKRSDQQALGLLLFIRLLMRLP